MLDALDADGDPVVLVGPLIHLEERERAHITGDWVDDSRYGLQVKVAEARPLPPTDTETLVAYLRRVRHVGAKRAVALIQRYGNQAVLDAIDRDPEEAFAAVGLRSRRAAEAADSWAELRVMRQLHLLLAPHGLGYLVGRLAEHYGPTAHRIVTEHPYELTSVFGVGFLIADRIARLGGRPPDDAERARAGILHLLAEAERSGSTCLPREALSQSLAELLGGAAPPGTLEQLIAARDVVAEEERWIYRAATAELEAELAHRVEALTDSEPNERLAATKAEAEPDQALTDEQRRGVANALRHRLSLITGGPGTGKTASIKSIAATATGAGRG